MNVDVTAIVERARLAATQPSADAGSERMRLERVAQEFESMLLVQVLRGMRTAGRWEDEDGDTLGAESMFETLDVELATQLARMKGLGLSKELLTSFDRMNPPAPIAMPTFDVPVVPVAGATHASPLPEPQEATVDSPVNGSVTSDYGWRRDPFTGAAKFHRGIDLKAAYGEDVQAAGEGRVVFSGQQGGYGTTVVIEHGDGTRTRYAHLSVALVGQGNAVASGQAIGRAGRSGRATGTHLHFEVIGADGQHVDPRMAMARQAGQMAGD